MTREEKLQKLAKLIHQECKAQEPMRGYSKGDTITLHSRPIEQATGISVSEQAKKWQQGASRHTVRLESLNNQLSTVIDKESRLAQAYADGIMSEAIYRAKYEEVSDTRNTLLKQIRTTENEIANSPVAPLEKLVDGVVKLVEDLDFAERRQIIQQVVDNVVATKKEVTVCGFIPVLAVQQVGLNGKHRHRRPPKRRQIYPI